MSETGVVNPCQTRAVLMMTYLQVMLTWQGDEDGGC
jgi:hypothetical protein